MNVYLMGNVIGEGEGKLDDKASNELSWFIQDPAGCRTFVGS